MDAAVAIRDGDLSALMSSMTTMASCAAGAMEGLGGASEGLQKAADITQKAAAGISAAQQIIEGGGSLGSIMGAAGTMGGAFSGSEGITGNIANGLSAASHAYNTGVAIKDGDWARAIQEGSSTVASGLQATSYTKDGESKNILGIDGDTAKKIQQVLQTVIGVMLCVQQEICTIVLTVQ